MIPARAEQAELIEESLPEVELVTVVLITLIVGAVVALARWRRW